MTEYDRGAYTPHADAPLAFDPRSPRERRPVPMTLVASGAVLAVLCGAVVMAYRHHGGVGGAPRTVGAPVGAVKTIAAPDATPKDPATTLDVYAPQNVAATPTFAPAPEAPAPREAPRVQMQAAADTPVRIEPPPPTAVTTTTVRTEVAAAPATAVVHGAADADARTVIPPAAKPVALAKGAAHAAAMTVASIRETDATIDAALARSAHPAAATSMTKASVAKPAVTVAKAPAAKPATVAAKAPAAKPTLVAKTATAATTAAAHGKAVVQIGAYNSAAIADTQFAAAKAAVGGGHGKVVSPVVVGGKTLYRTAFTGFADKASAQAFCSRLSAAGHTCIVKG